MRKFQLYTLSLFSSSLLHILKPKSRIIIRIFFQVISLTIMTSVLTTTFIMFCPQITDLLIVSDFVYCRAMIEIMPVGYTEYSFNMLSVPCKTWFYELHSMALPEHRPQYEEECGKDLPRMYHPCISLKSKDVYVNVTSMIPVVLHALERLGYNTGHIWFKNISES